MRRLPRLFAPAAIVWATAWCAIASPGLARPLACCCWLAGAVAVLLAVVARRRGRDALARVAAIAVVAAAGAGLVAAGAAAGAESRAASPLGAVEGRAAVTIELDGAPHSFTGFGERSLRLGGRAVALDGRPIPAVPVEATVAAPEGLRLSLGARVLVTGRVERLAPEESAAFLVRGVSIDVVGEPAPWLAWSAPLREGFRLAAEGLEGDGGALVPGLAIGDTSLVSDALDTAMKASSLSHLTAVSGANCAIVTAAAIALGAALGLRRGVRIVVALGALAAFVVLVTPEASVVRAAVMGAIVLAGLASGRGGGGLAALCLAVVVLLGADPWLARDYGFALSVLATGGLLLLAVPLTVQLARWMPLPIAALIGIPAAAQLACQPVLVLLDPAIAVLGVVANLLAGPAAPLGTVVGLVACLLLPVLPGPAAWLLELARLPAAWIAAVAHAVAGNPANRLEWIPGAAGAALLAAAALLVGWLAVSRRRGALRGAAWCLLLVLIGAPLGALLGGPLVTGASRPADWDVAVCDVGQGDAVVLRSAGRTALVDAGPDPQRLTDCLHGLGVERIELLVLTHWDHDHVGGASAVVGRVGAVLVGPPDGERSEPLTAALEAGGADVVTATRGLHGVLGELEWEVLWPMRADEPPGNDASVVLAVAGERYRMLMLGDLGRTAQERLRAAGEPGRFDLVKVAHHGSRDQSAALYAALGARVGLIGVGAGNGYGHPTGELLGMLADAGTAALRTDESGTFALRAAGEGFELWAERRASAADSRLDSAAHEGAAGERTEARWRSGRAARRDRRRRRRSRSWRGTTSARPRSCSSRAASSSSPSARSRGSATSSAPRTPPSR